VAKTGIASPPSGGMAFFFSCVIISNLPTMVVQVRKEEARAADRSHNSIFDY
jgi:hypothetical protein